MYEVSWLDLIEIHLVLTTVFLPVVNLPLYCYSISMRFGFTWPTFTSK
jgi:hypothetical protein